MSTVTKTLPVTEVLEFREGPGILAKDFRDEGVPLIRLAGLKSDADLLDGANYLDPGMVDGRWGHFRLREGDTLLSTSASLGRVKVVDSSGVGAIPYTGIVSFRSLDESVIRPDYVRFALTERAFANQIAAMGVGSVMNHFGPMHLKMMKLRVPSVPIQRVISEFGDALDGKILWNRTVASVSQALAVAVVATMADSVKLGDMVRMARKTIDPSSLADNTVKHFSLPAFDEGAAGDEAPASIKSAKNLLEEPVVLVSKLNPRIPRIWAVDRLPSELALASTEFVALAPRKVGIGAVWAALLDPQFTESVLERTGGTTGSHQRVKPEQMLDVEIRDVRELTTEKRELVESLCRKVNDIADENRRLAATRDELLPLLMSGKITVKDAEKTVEEVV